MGGDSGSTAINRKGKKEGRKTPSFIRSNKLLEMAEVPGSGYGHEIQA